MPGQHCVVCGNNLQKDPDCSFHRFTTIAVQRKCWLQLLEMTQEQLTPHSCICSRHFPGGDTSKEPQLNLGKRFSSPIKMKLPMAKRAKARGSRKELSTNSTASDTVPTLADTVPEEFLLTVMTSEQFYIDYKVHELPDESGDGLSDIQSTSV